MTGRAYPLYFVAGIAPRAAMFALLIVLTRLLPKAEYGLFVLVVTTSEILDMGLSNWVRIYLLRTEAGASRLCPRRLGRPLALNAATSFAAIMLAVPIAATLDRGRALELAAATAAYIAAFALLRLALTLLQLTGRHAAYATVEATRAAAIFAATGLAGLAGGHSFLPASLALSLATGTVAAAGLAATLKGIGRIVLPRTGYLAALSFAVPLILTSLLLYTLGWWDRYILNHFLGPASVAVYAAAYSITRQPVDLLIGSLNSYTFPILLRAHATGGAEQAARVQSGVLATVVLLGMAAVCGLTLLAEPLAAVLFPIDYRAEVAVLMPWMAVGAFGLAVKQFVLDNAFHVKVRYWMQLATMLPAAGAGLGLSLLLIRNHGVHGAAVAYALAAAVAIAASAVISYRVLPFRIPYGGLAKIAVSALGGVAAASALMPLAASWGAAAVIVAGTLGFSLAYGVSLTCFGFSLTRIMAAPWMPFAADGAASAADGGAAEAGVPRISSNKVA